MEVKLKQTKKKKMKFKLHIVCKVLNKHVKSVCYYFTLRVVVHSKKTAHFTFKQMVLHYKKP